MRQFGVRSIALLLTGGATRAVFFVSEMRNAAGCRCRLLRAQAVQKVYQANLATFLVHLLQFLQNGHPTHHVALPSF
ncbi:unnamed protein product [Symbiodinium pilosum]|uniref:Secreted protein n=1 Tax=Symbiodinium pilosum TaxID=2952 RepID=A0A812X1T6_SYMPI|nr:unnamed protein product [Symbiodinium pilosum]